MTPDRILIAVLGLALSVTAAASDPGRGPGRDNKAGQSGRFDEASRQVLIADELTALLASAGIETIPGAQAKETGTIRQVQVHWQTPGTDQAASDSRAAAGTLTVRKSGLRLGDLPRRRSLELADTDVLIVALDEKSRLLWWQVMTDPRLLRAETVTAGGEISGGVSYLPQVDFSISYPDDPAIAELRVFHPGWTGTEFRLTSLAALNVR